MDVFGRAMVGVGGPPSSSSARNWILRPTMIALFYVTYIWSLVEADGACFRRYDQQTKACKGLLFNRPDIQPLLCCERYGQGFARVILRVENRKKWYDCESCKLLDQTLRRRESNLGGVGYESNDDNGTDTSTKAVRPIGGRKLDGTEESATVAWRRLPGTSAANRHKLISEYGNENRDLTPATVEDEKKEEEEEEVEDKEEENIRAEEIGEEKEKEDDAEEEEERVEGADHSNSAAGGWSEWASWTPCTVSCGNGTRTRTRPCLNPPPGHGGINCQGSSTEKELCFLPACKVDGAWSAWSLWSVCSMTCGRGEQVRTRSCDEPRPAHGGNDCRGSTEERRDCDNLPCPVDGGWSNWSKWSNCSAVCGEGVQMRARTCDSPIPDHGGQSCDGPDRETMPCVTRINCPVDGNWTVWSRWDICSARPCSGQLGHRVRYRTCTNPRPMFGGRACKGRTWSRQACYNNEFCTQPVDGAWCNWVEWSSCIVGLQTRSRLCECPPPVNGGQDCPGIYVEEKSCQSTDDLLNYSPTDTPLVPDETRDAVQQESRGCGADESGDGSDVLCANEDDESSVDQSESTRDHQQHKT